MKNNGSKFFKSTWIWTLDQSTHVLLDGVQPGLSRAATPTPAQPSGPTYLLVQGHATGCVQAFGPLGLKKQSRLSPQPYTAQADVKTPGSVGHQLPQGHSQLSQRRCSPASPKP